MEGVTLEKRRAALVFTVFVSVSGAYAKVAFVFDDDADARSRQR